MLSKKHFTKIAEILATIDNGEIRRDLIGKFADYLAEENSRFDFCKFSNYIDDLREKK